MIRPLILSLSFIISLSLSAVTIKDAYTRQMETEQFQRVSEFFTGNENPGGATILRSQEEERDGLYFHLKLSEKLESTAVEHTFVLEVIRSDALKLTEYTFALTGKEAAKKRVILGLTGADWPDPELQAMAWRVRLLSGETEVASWKSFLWEMP